jgi:hypothetical protein
MPYLLFVRPRYIPSTVFQSYLGYKYRHCVIYTTVYSIYDSTEVAIRKMIEASQRMIKINSRGGAEGINPVMSRHFELEIKTFQNAPRDDAGNNKISCKHF